MSEWRPVVGYEGAYEVSDVGEVRRVLAGRGARSGKLLTAHALDTGHKRLKLCVGGIESRHLVHRLVARAFIGEPEPGQEVCHNDSNPANNAVGNLRWDTRSSNVMDAVRAGTHSQARKTHCPQGHEYNEENTLHLRTHTNRICKTCRRERRRA